MVGISTLNLNFVKTALSCRAKILKHSLSDKPANVKTTQPNRRVNEHGDIVVNKMVQAQKRLNDEEIASLLAGYENGKTANALAKQFGCNRTTVCNILKKHGLFVSNHIAQKKLDAADVIAMYSNMHKSQEIAEKYGVSPNVVIRFLRKRGITIRGRWDY